MAKVLVIEDDTHIWKMIEYKLKKEKHDLTWACDGMKAMEALEAAKPDLIISDIMIPYMDGLQILKKIKSMDNLKRHPGNHADFKSSGRRHPQGIGTGRPRLYGQTIQPGGIDTKGE